ncbi:MAG: PDZ domain-containing protein [Gemmatimonas sp.]|nr:PDZ domain-containing protein [Gemmatimonas sp.]
MLDPIRAKARIIGVTAACFVGGVLLASGMEWTAGSQATTLFQQAPAASEVQPIAELSESFISIAESVTPAVVSIRTERAARPASQGDVPEPFRRFFQPPDQEPQQAGGTGFIISEDGYILTNNHVVADADAIDVVTMDRREYDAELVGRDPTTDVAVIRIQGGSLPTVRVGDPADTRVGEWVLAVGNPLGLDFTVTAGIVSAKDRSIQIISRSIEDETLQALAVESFIQTDAAINPGNSGGPLVNIRGEVIGMNTAIASNTGLSAGYGFAVPIDLARHVAEDLIRYGRWRRAVLGVSINPVFVEDAEVFDLPSIGGAVVQGFSQQNTPAEGAGLRMGDVIVAVNGSPVSQVNALQRMIASHRPGDHVELDLIRYGEPVTLDVELIESDQRPITTANSGPAEPSRTNDSRLGILVAPLTRERANALGYSAPGGIVIEDFDPTSPLGDRLNARGWKIVSIDGEPVSDVSQYERVIGSKQPGAVVSLLLEGPGEPQRIVNVRLRE